MFHVLLIILFCLSVSSAGEYSLNELIDSAYKHSHLLAIADLQIEKNVEVVDDAKRNMLPKITFNGNYNYMVTHYNSMSSMIDGELPSFTEIYKDMIPGSWSYKTGDTLITLMLDYIMDGFVGTPPRNTITGGIDLRQIFFAQNKLRHSVDYARIQGRALICHWQDVRMRVKAEITRLYYAGLLSLQQTQIENQSRDIAESRHNQTLSLFNSHILSEIDTLNSFVDFSQSAVRLAEVKRNQREIFRGIAVAAGLKESVDSIVLTDTILLSAYKFNYEILQEHFLAENKDLRMLANEVDLAEMRVKIAKDDYYPIVYGGLALNRIANYKGIDDFNFAPERKLYLGVSYDITTFGQRRIRVKQCEYDLKIATHNYENKKEQLLLALKSNYEAISEEITKIEESKRILDASQKALYLAQNRYANGIVSQTEMEAAEQRFRQSGHVYLSAIFRYNSLLIDLRIMGADYLYEPIENAEKGIFDNFDNFYLRNQ
jgi:outer membrane protein TolC